MARVTLAMERQISLHEPSMPTTTRHPASLSAGYFIARCLPQMWRARGWAVALFLLASTILSAQPAPGPTNYTPKALAPSLRTQAGDALRRKDYATARRLLERWLEADPRDATSWYNLACSCALTGERALALDAFEHAVDAGFLDSALAQRDSDLESIRAEPRFTAGIARIAERQKQNEPPSWVVQRRAPMRTQGAYAVMLPPDYETNSREYPLCVLIHGSGGSEMHWDRLMQAFGREGVVYLAVRAPYASVDGIIELGEAAYTAWPPGQFPTGSPSIDTARREYVNWIFDAVTEVQKEFRVRKGKVFLYGYSQGGGIASTAAALYPEKVQSYLAQAGSAVPPNFMTDERIQRMKAEGVQAWLVHGREDTVVPVDRSTSLAERFKAASVSVELRLVAGDHPISAESTSVGKEWMEKIVKAAK